MSKLYRALTATLDKDEIIDWAEGNSAILAVTKDRVYLVKALGFSRPNIKSYAISSITSLHKQKPGLFTTGHLQIIASGVGDTTESFSTAFDYAKDENTIMIRNNYHHFVRLEKLIYKQKAAKNEMATLTAPSVEDDVFSKLEKLKRLLDAEIISHQEYEEKRLELLSRI